jgi:hypothetical protein
VALPHGPHRREALGGEETNARATGLIVQSEAPRGGCSATGDSGGAWTAGAGESVPCCIQLIADLLRPSVNIIVAVYLAAGPAVMQRTKDPVPD